MTSPEAPAMQSTLPRDDLPAETAPVLPYGNAMRVLASVAVIAIHVQTRVAMEVGSPGVLWTGTLVNVAARWCVPVFFMLSGALLLNAHKVEPSRAFYAKRARRLIVPLIVWSAIFLVLPQLRAGTRVPAWPWLVDSAARCLRGTPNFHLWFAFALLGLYAVTPAVRVARQRLSDAEWAGAAWFCVALAAAATLAWAALGDTGFPPPPGSNVFVAWLPHLGFFLLGPMLVRWRLTSRRLAAAGVVYVVATVVGLVGLRCLPESGRVHAIFEAYECPQVAAQAIAMFMLIRAAFTNPSPAVRWLGHARLSDATLAVYLLHPLAIGSGFRAGRTIAAFSGPLHVLVAIFATVVLSFAVAIALRAMPIVRSWIG